MYESPMFVWRELAVRCRRGRRPPRTRRARPTRATRRRRRRRPGRGGQLAAADPWRRAQPAAQPHASRIRALLKINLSTASGRPTGNPRASSSCVELVLAFRIPTNKPSLPLRSHAPCSGLHREYHETHAVSCPSALRVDPPGCMHASSETHAVSECPMFRHTCVAQSPTPFPPYSHP